MMSLLPIDFKWTILLFWILQYTRGDSPTFESQYQQSHKYLYTHSTSIWSRGAAHTTDLQHIVLNDSISLMANYQLMSTQIPLPLATKTPLCSPVQEDPYCFKRGSKMFIPVAMIHCGERLLLTHSPQISLLHLPPASSHRNAASLGTACIGKTILPENTF